MTHDITGSIGRQICLTKMMYGLENILAHKYLTVHFNIMQTMASHSILEI